jgi:hypothetical protein
MIWVIAGAAWLALALLGALLIGRAINLADRKARVGASRPAGVRRLFAKDSRQWDVPGTSVERTGHIPGLRVRLHRVPRRPPVGDRPQYRAGSQTP